MALLNKSIISPILVGRAEEVALLTISWPVDRAFPVGKLAQCN